MSISDDEMENEAYAGGLCFLQPHFDYFPPRFYRHILSQVGVLFCLSPLFLLLLLLGFAFVKLDYVFLFVSHNVFLSFCQLNLVPIFCGKKGLKSDAKLGFYMNESII